MKRILSLIIILLMLMQMSVFARSPFTDVSGDEYYAEAAKQLYNSGLISGYEDGSLRAHNNVTRAEMAAFICRLLDAEDYAMDFKGTTTKLTKDVGKNHWASGYIAYAVDRGFVNGYGDGNFKPDNKVKYQEAVKMLVCAVGLEDKVESVPGDWAQGYMNTALEAGILNNVIYDGGDYSNRSDVVMMLYNVITYVDFEKETPDAPVKEEPKEDSRDESGYEEWEKYDHYDENGKFITHELTVTMSGCGGIRDTSGNYPAGSNVPLYIYPGTESGFIRWTSTAGTLINPDSTTCILTMPDEDVVVCAEFADPGVVVREYNSEDDYWYLIKETDSKGNNNSSDHNDESENEEQNISLEDFEQEVIRLVNEERKKNGLNELIRDEQLTAVAYAHSRDMKERNFFSHNNPDGKSPFDRMDEYGIMFMTAAENIAKGQPSPEVVMESWMNSPGHRANILSAEMKYIGVGICEAEHGYFWTQCFKG